MALGRTLQHRFFKPGWMHGTDASKRIPWRSVALICMAVMAGALATYSLIVDPADTSPAPTSYLP
jgi:hypothetical protein